MIVWKAFVHRSPGRLLLAIAYHAGVDAGGVYLRTANQGDFRDEQVRRAGGLEPLPNGGALAAALALTVAMLAASLAVFETQEL